MDTELDRSLAIARELLALAEKRKTPLTPDNYEILFRYLAARDEHSIEEIDDALDSEGTERTSSDDVPSSSGEDTMCDALYEVGTGLNDEIRAVRSVVANAGGAARTYGESLRAVDSQVSELGGDADIRLVIDELVHSSLEMEIKSREMEAKLAESSRKIELLNSRLEGLRTEMAVDPLTEIFNRRHFDEVLRQQLLVAEKSDQDLCLCMCDIDRFKAFNDTHGHQTGDQVLRLVAHTISTHMAVPSVAARYGGEEFAILLPETHLKDATTLANKIRNAVRFRDLIKRSSGVSLGRITISIGIARYIPGELPYDLIRRADDCLYAAKRAGRDRVVSEADKKSRRASSAA